jgi:hypothetical protein
LYSFPIFLFFFVFFLPLERHVFLYHLSLLTMLRVLIKQFIQTLAFLLHFISDMQQQLKSWICKHWGLSQTRIYWMGYWEKRMKTQRELQQVSKLHGMPSSPSDVSVAKTVLYKQINIKSTVHKICLIISVTSIRISIYRIA